MTLRILPLGNGFALVDTNLRDLVPVWFLYEDAAEVFRAYVERFHEVNDERKLAAAIESFLIDLDTVDLGMVTTPAQKLEAFLGSPEYAALERKAA